MTNGNKLGIWMDHSTAHLIEFTNGVPKRKTLTSAFTHETKEASLHKGEHVMHVKEQGLLADYYRTLAEAIKNYQTVLLFGPTDAKQELFNSIKGDNRFENVKIELMPADKMTENQQHAFVQDYFSKHESIGKSENQH
jgi:hypothetical protein